VFATKTTTVAARQVVPAGGDFCGGEERSLGVGARSAHPKLTRRTCLNVANEVSEVSLRRDSKASTTAQSERSGDRHSMSPLRVPPAAPRKP